MSAPRLLADRALARRLERDQMLSLVECVETLGRLDASRDVAVLELAGGRAAYAGRGSFFSEACGFAMEAPIAEEDFDRLYDFYRSRECPARVEICPLADASLFTIASRGYQLKEFHNVLVQSLRGPGSDRTGAPRATPDDLTIEPVDASRYALWAEICAAGFFEDPDERTTKHLEFVAFTQLPGSRFSLAFMGGRPAGAAAWGEREGLALLYATSVLSEFRGHGVHAALIESRLAQARARGCDLAVGVALAGSSSQRNFERAGFHPAYSKVMFVRDGG